nr:hypothetical protein [Tanacetum cinerariifolium]
MSSIPVLALLNFSKEFMVDTDALGFGIRMVLMQEGRPIAYYSQTLGSRAVMKSVYEQELMAILLAIQKWRPYLLGKTYKADNKNKRVDALSRREDIPTCLVMLVSRIVNWEDMLEDLGHSQKPQMDTRIFDEFHSGAIGGHSGGLLQPLALPDKVWDEVSMDFIEGLPKSDGFATILVVVDRLSKYSHFIPLRYPYTASIVAAAFLREIVRLHGIPIAIVSDRDKIFLSNFWKELFRLQGTNLRYSTAYHPHTNGQTEVVNKRIETYLRCFTSKKPKKLVQVALVG